MLHLWLKTLQDFYSIFPLFSSQFYVLDMAWIKVNSPMALKPLVRRERAMDH
jgi:hypothetical protein